VPLAAMLRYALPSCCGLHVQACLCMQVYLVNVTFDIMECKAALTPKQSDLPVWCVLCGLAAWCWGGSTSAELLAHIPYTPTEYGVKGSGLCISR
jgi:hypothetical protein